MTGICFYYDDIYRTQWDDLCRMYKVQGYELETPEDATGGIWKFPRDISEIDPDKRIVIQPQNAPHMPGKVSLKDFNHPNDCVYVFGSDKKHNEFIEAKEYVYIPTPSNKVVWSFQSAGIVMYDRWIKLNG